jgi:hypothetical protein
MTRETDSDGHSQGANSLRSGPRPRTVITRSAHPFRRQRGEDAGHEYFESFNQVA